MIENRMPSLPEGFKEMLKDLLGDEEACLLIAHLEMPPVTSVRLNRRKPVAEFSDTSPVAWCRSGLYLPERPEFIFDPLLHAGAYYVQDASSMIYETMAERLVELFKADKSTRNPNTGGDPTLKVLDLCAAPGGKTTAMINGLPDGSRITANEYSPKRVGALKENIERWGYPDVTVTNRDSSYFATQGENFDIVAVDAPCSGEGMMRKEEMARKQWSPQLIMQCSSLQREILQNAEKALKPGGFLIYSTCTFNREENEKNAEYISNKLGLEPVDLELPDDWGISHGIATSLPVYRFMPHKTRGEGLFLSVFRKRGEWTESKPAVISVKQPKGKRTIQAGVLKNVEAAAVNVEVGKTTALKYLKGESIVLPPETPKGLVTITYKGLPLGEAKNIGSRANNLLPKNRRILKKFP
ncbi:MAG: methyltransferase domain-containing protein [Muribaculaceae bacterium]|nr:methyltransferase domain-containing protein [Muribaculaceae bacterium]